MDLEELLAEAGCKRAMTAFNIAADRGKIDVAAQQFTDDAVMTFSGRTATGRDGIFAMLSSINHDSDPAHSDEPPVTKLRHHVTTSQIVVDGDEAAGRSYFIIFTNNGPYHAGVYMDRFRKVDGRWLISRREVRVDWYGTSSMDRFKD